jgi:IclR family pca regulon transcriptional regulator
MRTPEVFLSPNPDGVGVPRRRFPPILATEDAWAPIPTLVGSAFSQSVERGLAILDCFTAWKPVLGVAEVADALGMSRSTTHRYMMTLERIGYLDRAPTRKYRLSLRVVDLGLSALHSTALSEHARSFLVELSESTGFTTGVGVLDWPQVLVVEHASSQRRRRLEEGYLRSEALLPAHCTGIGKLLAAALPLRARRELVGELSLARRTPRTITSKRGLIRELKQLGGKPVVVAEEEHTAGVLEIAAAVRGDAGETVAALALEVSSRAISLDDLVGSLGPHLIAAADGVSARLGYRRADERSEWRAVGRPEVR